MINRKTAKLLLFLQKYGQVLSVLILTVLCMLLALEISPVVYVILELLFGTVIGILIMLLANYLNTCICVKLSIFYNWMIYNCIILESQNLFSVIGIDVMHARNIRASGKCKRRTTRNHHSDTG